MHVIMITVLYLPQSFGYHGSPNNGIMYLLWVFVSDFFFFYLKVQVKAKRNAWPLNFHFCPLLSKAEPHTDSLIAASVVQGGDAKL